MAAAATGRPTHRGSSHTQRRTVCAHASPTYACAPPLRRWVLTAQMGTPAPNSWVVATSGLAAHGNVMGETLFKEFMLGARVL